MRFCRMKELCAHVYDNACAGVNFTHVITSVVGG